MNSINRASNNIALNVQVPQQTGFPYFSTAFIAIIAIVLVAIGCFLTWRQWNASPWFSDRAAAEHNLWAWWNNPSVAMNSSGSIQQVTPTILQPVAPVTKSTSERNPNGPPESWCFVGEDLTGRYCIKVPSDTNCDAERTFRTRRDCELVPANKLTAGIVKNGGKDIQLLSSLMLY